MAVLDTSVKHLLQELRTNTSAVRLDLSFCHLRFDADSCPLLVEILQENKTLKVMHLDFNFMSDEALLALGEDIKENRGLHVYTLGIMTYGEGGGACWQHVSEREQTLHTIWMTPIQYIERLQQSMR